MGRRVGMTTTDGIYIDERLVKRVDASGPKSAQMVLQNPRVDTAVFEVARGGILREGLGYGRNDIGVVLNVTGDHLGLREIETLEQLAAVKRVVIEAVPRNGWGVLNADDPLVLDMRQPLQRQRDPVLDADQARPRRAMDPPRSQGRGAGAERTRRDDGDQGGAAHDADRVGPHPALHLRRQGPDDGAERHGGCRGGARRPARTCTTSGRVCGRSRRRSIRRPVGSTCSISTA